MDGYIGTILPVAFDYAPDGWMLCQGQTLSIQQYTALYALLGVRFGGDAKTTFALPDLRGYVMVGSGTPIAKTGLPSQPLTLGQQKGYATTTIASANLPQIPPMPAVGTHTHAITVAPTTTASLNAQNSAATLQSPGTTEYLASATGGGANAAKIYTTATTAPVALAGLSVAVTATATAAQAGGSPAWTPNYGAATPTPISVMQPTFVVNFIICVTGFFPPQPQ